MMEDGWARKQAPSRPAGSQEAKTRFGALNGFPPCYSRGARCRNANERDEAYRNIAIHRCPARDATAQRPLAQACRPGAARSLLLQNRYGRREAEVFPTAARDVARAHDGRDASCSNLDAIR